MKIFLYLLTIVSFLIFINIGLENRFNWKFFASLFSLLGFITLIIMQWKFENAT